MNDETLRLVQQGFATISDEIKKVREEKEDTNRSIAQLESAVNKSDSTVQRLAKIIDGDGNKLSLGERYQRVDTNLLMLFDRFKEILDKVDKLDERFEETNSRLAALEAKDSEILTLMRGELQKIEEKTSGNVSKLEERLKAVEKIAEGNQKDIKSANGKLIGVAIAVIIGLLGFFGKMLIK